MHIKFFISSNDHIITFKNTITFNNCMSLKSFLFMATSFHIWKHETLYKLNARSTRVLKYISTSFPVFQDQFLSKLFCTIFYSTVFFCTVYLSSITGLHKIRRLGGTTRRVLLLFLCPVWSSIVSV